MLVKSGPPRAMGERVRDVLRNRSARKRKTGYVDKEARVVPKATQHHKIHTSPCRRRRSQRQVDVFTLFLEDF